MALGHVLVYIFRQNVYLLGITLPIGQSYKVFFNSLAILM